MAGIDGELLAGSLPRKQLKFSSAGWHFMKRKHMLHGTMLKDESIFTNPSVFHGVITWDNGNVDISPETVYQLSYEYNAEAI